MVYKAKKFVYAKPFDGMPTEENLIVVEEELPPIKDGEFLAEAVYLSVDPYMRAYSSRFELGQTMIGSQVAKIIESKNSDFPVGKNVIGQFGWRSLTISNGGPDLQMKAKPFLLPDYEGISLSLFLGILGMPGNTAYFGFLEICKPKPGDMVVVSAAAGAVGSHVGQLAKIKGCTVIGLTGSEEKANWLKSLGFDFVINYKTANIREELAKAAPGGVDCYFDNVGGEISSIIMQQMKRFGRVAACGSISSYNAKVGELPKATVIQPSIVLNELEIKGFIVSSWMGRWMEGITENMKWLKEGKLRYRETITEGFENTTKALVGVLKGDNIGKAVVKV